MGWDESYQRNVQAYERLRDEIERTYPRDRCVAIVDGRIAADAPNLKELDALLLSAGMDPRDSLVVRVGMNYPEYLHILFIGPARRRPMGGLRR